MVSNGRYFFHGAFTRNGAQSIVGKMLLLLFLKNNNCLHFICLQRLKADRHFASLLHILPIVRRASGLLLFFRYLHIRTQVLPHFVGILYFYAVIIL